MKKRKKTVSHIKVFGMLLILIGIFFFTYNVHKIGFTGFAVYTSQQSDINDTYLRENSDSNFGNSIKMQVGKSATNLQLRPLIKFNLSSVNSSNTVLNATLQIYVSYSSTNNTISISTYPLTSDWNEFEAGWNNRATETPWGTAGGDYSNEINSTVLNSTGWYNISITSIVRNWVKDTDPNYGLILIATTGSSGDFKEISSSSASDQSLIPKLTIHYVENDPPHITNITTDSSISNPKNIGNPITFNIDWTDLENDAAQIFICNTSNISTSGCTGRTFCSVESTTTSPISCQYTTLLQDNRTTRYFAGACSTTTCSQIFNATFYTNHQPSINITTPNGGEIINQSLGEYLIKFNTSDKDSDPMTANIYYGLTKNSTTNLLATINLTERCNPTTKICNYSWDSTGLYGEYFLTIIANDTFSTSLASSNASFSVRSLIDVESPAIISQGIDNYIYSGKNTTITTVVTDPNLNTIWAIINETSQIISMHNITEFGDYIGSFIAGQIGTYHFKIYANDTVGNLNDTMPWQEFNISKPTANTSNELSPTTSLPFNVIRISGEINTSDSLTNSYAFLNIPDGFSFLSESPQYLSLGNFSGEKQAIWYVSTPISEGNYNLNITYYDGFSNTWQSSNFNTSVTSTIGGGTSIGGNDTYGLSISGYPETTVGKTYYAEATFTKNGQPSDPDSIELSLFDPVENLIVGPIAMSQKQLGIYRYTYNVPNSTTAGIWQTIVNATKNLTNYISGQYWNLVGALFDVANITVVNSTSNNLDISVDTINKGQGQADLTLLWNLTRIDTDQQLDSGAETFAVGQTTITKHYSPNTDYIGQVKITFLGRYSTTETAGAFKIFSITPPTNDTQPPITPPSAGGGGGGGGSVKVETKNKTDLTANFENPITLTKNIEKIISFEIKNIGNTQINNANLSIEGLDSSQYTITPNKLTSLKLGDSSQFKIKFMITDLTTNVNINFIVNSKEITKKFSAEINLLSLKEFFTSELARLMSSSEKLKINATKEIISEIENCDTFINSLNTNIQAEELISAKDNIKNADNCLNNVKDKINKLSNIPFTGIKITDYWVWIITWTLIIMLILTLIIILYVLYKRFSILSFLRDTPKTTSPQHAPEKESFDKRIDEIEKKLGKTS